MSVFSTIFCFLSTFFIIQLAFHFYGLPRITIQVDLIAAIFAVVLSRCAAQCIGAGINQRQISPYADQYVAPKLTINVQMTSSFSLSCKGSWPSYVEKSMLEKYMSTFTFSQPLSLHFFFPRRVHSQESQHLRVVNGKRKNGPRETRSLWQ